MSDDTGHIDLMDVTLNLFQFLTGSVLIYKGKVRILTADEKAMLAVSLSLVAAALAADVDLEMLAAAEVDLTKNETDKDLN